MAEHDLVQHLEVGEDDRAVATADVTTRAGSEGTARVSLHSEAAHIAPGRRACLVDAVLDLPAVRPCHSTPITVYPRSVTAGIAIMPSGDCMVALVW